MQSIPPTQFKGHGAPTRDNTRDYTELQEGPLCPLLKVPYKGSIDSSSYELVHHKRRVQIMRPMKSNTHKRPTSSPLDALGPQEEERRRVLRFPKSDYDF